MWGKLPFALRMCVLALIPMVMPNTSSGHGYIMDSRSHLCAQHVNSNCGAIQFEPQSVEGPDRFPDTGPADGEIASAANARFSELDEQTPVSVAKEFDQPRHQQFYLDLYRKPCITGLALFHHQTRLESFFTTFTGFV